MSYQSMSRFVKPKHVFYYLMKTLRPELVLDIGSRDGGDSLQIRKASPGSRIIAFEANPELFAAMQTNGELARNHIEVRGYAVSNRTGEGDFLIFNETKGMGSLLPSRAEEFKHTEQRRIPVEMVRVDQVPEARQASSIALWIDVEGCAYEVIDGASGVLDQVCVIQAEVEYGEFWQDQKLAADLGRELEAKGFVKIFERVKRFEKQGNAIYARRGLAPMLTGPSRVARFAAAQIPRAALPLAAPFRRLRKR